MESKGVSRAVIIMGLLILGLVVAKTSASSSRVDCKTHLSQELYNYCVGYTDVSVRDCAKAARCTLVPDDSSHLHSNMLQNSGDHCKLGCVSSVCDTITTNKNSGEVEEAMKRCVNACSELCSKGAKTVLASAY